MELEIAEKNDNPLLHRQEVQIVIRHENESTPRRSEVIQNLSDKMNAKKDLIIIDHLNEYTIHSHQDHNFPSNPRMYK